MKRRYWMLLSGLVLTASACRGSGNEGPSPADRPVHVEVSNKFALPVEIFFVGGGANYRLGLVHPGMSGSFTVPPALIGNGSAEFQARPTPPTRGMYRSGPLLIAPGRTVDLVIAAQLFNSTATLRQ